MKKIFFLVPVLFCLSSLRAETMFLKDGQIVEGKLFSETKNELSVVDQNNKIVKIRRDNVIRVMYMKQVLAKKYIQMRSGKTMTAFIVDEDQESYTVRRELYKPAEEKIRRVDVLFMAEKNPSGLKGEIVGENVKLSWFSPYDGVKKYNIYAKRKKSDVYSLAASTEKNEKEIVLKNLEPGKRYFFTVKAVDLESAESIPSNEVMIETPSSKTGSGNESARSGKNGEDNRRTVSIGLSPVIVGTLKGPIDDLADHGFGISCEFSPLRNSYERFDPKLSAGFVYFGSRKNIRKTGDVSGNLKLFPIQAEFGYRIIKTRYLHAGPWLGGGVVFGIADYKGKFGGETEKQNGRFVRPLASGGLALDMILSSNFIITARGGCSVIFEKEKSLYSTAEAGLTFVF
jgi:hypothetical protein